MHAHFENRFGALKINKLMCRFSVWKVRNRRNGKKCRTFVWNSERNVFPSAHTHTQKMIVLSPIFRTLQNAIDAIFTPFFYSTRNRHHIQTHTAEQMTKSFPFQHEFFNTKSMLWYFSFDLLINEQIVACWTNFFAPILESLFWRVSLEIRVLQMTARTHHTMHCLDFHSLTN